MKDLDNELWKLGIPSKTKHNEAAPSQHELAPVFTSGNIATDHNQLTMEMMKKVAARHGLACLLHEKPFDGVNGSGKHDNWSLCTDSGTNLFDPGVSPRENAQFLLFLTAVIKAVDEHQDLLRISVASAGNDHRLGGDEAPPAIVSIFLGDELTDILASIENGSSYNQKNKSYLLVGTDVLPNIPKDTTDRNRTSPFAFTGNKFEFRMLGSSVSIACPNMMLNTSVAEALCEFADELEKSDNFTAALNELIKRNIKQHKRIIFNGNNYSAEWVKEAEKRGLLNLPSTADALPYYVSEKNIAMFEKFGVLSGSEVHSRYEITLENYYKQIHIEALTMLDMINRDILPSVCKYSKVLSSAAINKEHLGVSNKLEKSLLQNLANESEQLYNAAETLSELLEKQDFNNIQEMANYYRNPVLMQMEKARLSADRLEKLTGSHYWPYPTYGELLSSVL